MKNVICSLWLLLLLIASPLVLAIPPYLGVTVGENLSFTNSSCIAATKKVLENEGFQKIVQYQNGTTVFAAYQTSEPYRYKAVVKCLSDAGVIMVVAVADVAKNAKQKTEHLLQKIRQYHNLKAVSIKSSSAPSISPYLGISVGKNGSFANSSCSAAAKEVLKNDGFQKVVPYNNGKTVFAAYHNRQPYRYKVVVKCLSDAKVIMVVAVAERARSAKKKADSLRRKIQNYRGSRTDSATNAKKNTKSLRWKSLKFRGSRSYSVKKWLNPFQGVETLLQQDFRQNNRDKRLIIQTISTGGSFVDSVIINGAVLVKKGRSWQVESAANNIATAGTYGFFHGEAKWVKIGSEQYGVLFLDSGGHMGYNFQSFFIVAAVGNQMTKLFQLDDAGRNNAAAGCLPKCESYKTELKFVPGKHPDYFDIQAITTGTVQKRELFSVSGTKYQRVK
ncbi:MAG: hypothetical protein DRR08_23835 [Candidatus Parabeggiatoa sp. nov. 2]|nr:MAG: hypothetical protein B6247_11425 [Beggiatoa sp. 4572_84]RKZ55618.1 MAG: hypothetical protein DRR08_23835 [Gammaproteobacteria bacterium]